MRKLIAERGLSPIRLIIRVLMRKLIAETGVESNPIEYTSIDDCGERIDCGVVGESFWGTNLEKKNSILPLRIIKSVKSCIRKRRENIQDIERRKKMEIESGKMVDREREWKVKARELNRLLGRIHRITGF